MPPKKGKKGKKKGKKKDPKEYIDKTYCSTTITDLNRRLARLRGETTKVEDTNIKVKEQLKVLKEDKLDVAAYLERKINERNDIIRELEERMEEIEHAHVVEKELALERINDLEHQYKVTHENLLQEIELLDFTLTSQDEFRLEREALYARFAAIMKELKQMDSKHREVIFGLERKAVVDKDVLKKEINAKLQQIADDFTRSSEIRNAGYTRRLIRENIALQKEIDVLVIQHIKVQLEFKEQTDLNKEINEHYAALEQMNRQLTRNSRNKIDIIDKLAVTYERLETKFVESIKYRRLHDTANKQQLTETYNFKGMQEKISEFNKEIVSLEKEKRHLLKHHQQLEIEIFRLRDVLTQIRMTVLQADAEINVEDDFSDGDQLTATPSEENLRAYRRQGLILELVNILSSRSENIQAIAQTASVFDPEVIYNRGKLGFVPQKKTFVEVFRFDAERQRKQQLLEELEQLEREKKMLRKSISGDLNKVTEIGSTIYISSSSMTSGDGDDADPSHGVASGKRRTLKRNRHRKSVRKISARGRLLAITRRQSVSSRLTVGSHASRGTESIGTTQVLVPPAAIATTGNTEIPRTGSLHSLVEELSSDYHSTSAYTDFTKATQSYPSSIDSASQATDMSRAKTDPKNESPRIIDIVHAVDDFDDDCSVDIFV